MHRLHTFTLGALGALLIAGPAAAAQTIGDEDHHIKIGGLLQAWANAQQDAAPDGGTETEMYLRRIRLMVFGKVEKKISFFIETDNPNFGRRGDFSGRMFIQDAYVEYEVSDALQVAAGLILVPFSHHGMQGATSLLGLDYHAALIRYPTGSNLVWRDTGVMARGMPFGNVFEYRLGVFNGVHGDATPAAKTSGASAWSQATDPRNPSDAPRLAARVTLNAFDPEGGPGVGGMFYDGIYLEPKPEGLVSPKTVLSLGGSLDWQRKLNVQWAAAPATGTRQVASRSDYVAAAGDVFWDIPVGPEKIMSANGQVDVYYYDHGDRRSPDAFYAGSATMFSGIGVAAEAGFRYDIVEPVVLFDWFDSKEANGKDGDVVGIAGGVNTWLSGHTTTLKMQAGAVKTGDQRWLMTGTLQAQLLF